MRDGLLRARSPLTGGLDCQPVDLAMDIDRDDPACLHAGIESCHGAVSHKYSARAPNGWIPQFQRAVGAYRGKYGVVQVGTIHDVASVSFPGRMKVAGARIEHANLAAGVRDSEQRTIARQAERLH